MGQEHKEYTWHLITRKLMGEASPEELLELEELLRNNPGLHYPMQTISDLWNPATPEERQVAEEAFSRHLDRMEDLKIDYHTTPLCLVPTAGQAPQSYKTKRTWLIAATLLAGIVITGLYLATRNPAQTAIPASTATSTIAGSEIFTGNGSRTHLTLPDGTVVYLNAGSRINYEKNFGAATRTVSLTGEAFFDVAPNAGKPFVIHTAHIDIRVLGTSFNVKSYPTDKTTEATLIRGSIEVSIRNRASDRIVLKPNEKLIVNNEDSSLLEKDIASHHRGKPDQSIVVIGKPTYEHNSGTMIETSWVDNKLIFQDEEFRDLARRMERWYGVTIRFTGADAGIASIQEQSFTGTFEKETVQQALDALKLTGKFNYSINGTQITIHD